MALDPERAEAITFDSYGTIVDVTTVEEPLAEYVDEPELVSQLWRNRSLGYAMVANAIEEYDSFYQMNRTALQYALNVAGVDVSEDEREEILSTYDELAVFEDAVPGMERLQDMGYDLYVVSNGSHEMLDGLVEHAGIGDLIEGTISADEVETFKPVSELYQHAADEIGVPIEEITFVAAGWWDVPGAIHAGMQGVWINRQDTIWGPYETEPASTIETFHDLADELEEGG